MKILAPVLLFCSVIAACLGLMIVLSCGSVDCSQAVNASNAKCVTEQAIIDCTTPAATSFVATNKASVSKFFTAAGIDWAAVENALLTLVVPDAVCVLEDVVKHYLEPSSTPAIDAGLTTTPSLTPAMVQSIEPAVVRQKSDELKAKLWPGKKTRL